MALLLDGGTLCLATHIGELYITIPSVSLSHQCPHCFTLYDELYGDVLSGIPAGVSFGNLPDGYTCPTCDTPKTDFIAIALPDPAVL